MISSLNNEDLAVLDVAFRKACAQLLLAANDEDSERRMRLAKIVVSIANEGERNATEIVRRALELMTTKEPA
jgi:hypothetical protein